MFLGNPMTELSYLIWSALLAGMHVLVQSETYRHQYGLKHAAGARDDEAPRTPVNGRAERALRNFLETYPIFVALSAGILIGGLQDQLTLWGAALYFWSRWLYLPLYLFGVPNIRSLVWLVSVAGLGVMFLGAVL